MFRTIIVRLWDCCALGGGHASSGALCLWYICKLKYFWRMKTCAVGLIWLLIDRWLLLCNDRRKAWGDVQEVTHKGCPLLVVGIVWNVFRICHFIHARPYSFSRFRMKLCSIPVVPMIYTNCLAFTKAGQDLCLLRIWWEHMQIISKIKAGGCGQAFKQGVLAPKVC